MCQILPPPGVGGQLNSYAPLSLGDETYVPLATNLHWSTDFLLQAAKPRSEVEVYSDGRRKHMFSHEYIGEVITEDRSEGAIYRPVIVLGRRKITFPATHPKFPFTGGARDCYVHWLTMPGAEFTHGRPLDNANLIAAAGDVKVFRAQKKRGGALYSRSVTFDAQGEPNGYSTTVVLIEFAWYLGPPDNVKLDLYAHTYAHEDERAQIETPRFLTQFRPSLLEAWLRAKKGFDQTCQAFPQETRDQHNLWLAEAPAYGKKLLGRNWMDVFDEITDTWQLVEACRVLTPDEFSHRRTLNKRGRDMVNAYCSQKPGRADLFQRLWEEASVVLKAP